jgi:predicted N-formylglutamate amidohydrolase
VAVSKHKSQSHAAQFCGSLSISQRNSLRAILLHEHACRDLKRALGIEKADTTSHAAHATGCAKLGNTISLFRDHARGTAVNLPGFAYGVGKEIL